MTKIPYLRLMILVFSILLFDNSINACPILKAKKRMICYFASWSGGRPSPANIQPEDFDPCLCSHVLYSFVNLRSSKLELSATDQNLFPRMAKWKLKNPFIKISISIGGWNEQSTHFSPMVSTQENRNMFCQSVIDTCRSWNLDGIDIDWEYPSDYQRDQYTATIQTCFDMFTAEAQTSGKKKLLISAATAPDSRMSSLNIPVLNNLLDFINPMTYDIHGSWDGNNAHHSGLYGWGGADGTLQRYISAGMSPSKLNLGLAAYARSTADAGPYTREYGVLAYYEVCQLLCKTWYDTYDDTIKAPKALNRNGYGHAFYDNQRSMVDKANYVMNSNIGGAFIWDTSLDDFNGQFCCQGKFPLISTVVNVFNGNTSISNNYCCGGEITTTTTAPTTAQTTASTNAQGSTQSTASVITSSTSFSTVSTEFGICDGSKQLYPHPTDCQKFIKCQLNENSEITEVVETCGGGTLFNPNNNVCDWPQNVVCQNYSYSTQTITSTATKPTTTVSSIITTLSTTTTPTTTTAPTTTSTAQTTTVTYDQSGIDYSQCPSGRRYSPHPTDCAKFMNCEKVPPKGDLVETTVSCPANLLFNSDLSLCDWPQNVVCKTGSTTVATVTTTTTATADGTEYICLKDGVFGSPVECAVYYECLNGVSKKKTCVKIGITATYYDIYKQNCYFKTSAQIYPGCAY